LNPGFYIDNRATTIYSLLGIVCFTIAIPLANFHTVSPLLWVWLFFLGTCSKENKIAT